MLEYIAKIAMISKQDKVIFMILFLAINDIRVVNAFNRRYLTDGLSKFIDVTRRKVVVAVPYLWLR